MKFLVKFIFRTIFLTVGFLFFVPFAHAQPTAPGDFGTSGSGPDFALIKFGASAVSNNFSNYKVYYSTSTEVTEADNVLTSSEISALGSIDFGGAAYFEINNLEPNSIYYISLWAYDTDGSKASSTVRGVVTKNDVSFQSDSIEIHDYITNNNVAQAVNGFGTSTNYAQKISFVNRTVIGYNIPATFHSINIPANTVFTAQNGSGETVYADFTGLTMTDVGIDTIGLPVSADCVFSFGFTDKKIVLDQVATTTIYCGTANAGKTYSMYRKSIGDESWNYLGDYVVGENGRINILTTQFSDFAGGEIGSGVPEFSTYIYILTLAGAGWMVYDQLTKQKNE